MVNYRNLLTWWRAQRLRSILHHEYNLLSGTYSENTGWTGWSHACVTRKFTLKISARIQNQHLNLKYVLAAKHFPFGYEQV